MKRVAAVAAVGAARFDDARRFAIDALDAVTSWGEAELAELHNVVAWADLLLGDDALLDEAERHARLALDATPSAATYDTWGWIELRRGRAVEAHGWFTEAFRATHSGQRDIRAVVAFGLSRAARALGDYQLADAWKHTAERGRGDSTVLVPPFARPVAAPLSPWTRTRLDRLAIVGNTAGEGTRWWLWLTLALCLVPLPLVDLAAHHYGPFVVWSIIVTALLITAERSRRAVRVTTVG
jgi:hypothetical protein